MNITDISTVDKKNKKEWEEIILRILNNLLRVPPLMILGEYNNISLLNLYNPSARIVKVEEFDFLLGKKEIFQSRRKIRVDIKKSILLSVLSIYLYNE